MRGSRHPEWQMRLLEAEYRLFTQPTELRISAIAVAIRNTTARVKLWYANRRKKEKKEFRAVASQLEPTELRNIQKTDKMEKKKKRRRLAAAEKKGIKLPFSPELTEFLKKMQEKEAQEKEAQDSESQDSEDEEN